MVCGKQALFLRFFKVQTCSFQEDLMAPKMREEMASKQKKEKEKERETKKQQQQQQATSAETQDPAATVTTGMK